MKNIVLLLVSIVFVKIASAQEWDPASTEWYHPVPPVVLPGTLPGQPPSDAVVLFDGTSLSKWKSKDGTAPKWQINNGELVIVPGAGHIYTQDYFGDCQIHVEFKIPESTENGSKRSPGNSGVHIQDKYEIQILDNDDDIFINGMVGSVYKQAAPLVNAYTNRGEWQSLDIYWTAPKFGTGGVFESPAVITVVMNGVAIHNHYVLKGNTPYRGLPDYQAHGRLPLRLSEHGDVVSYRNIWIRNL